MRKSYILIASIIALISLVAAISNSTNTFPINTNNYPIHYDIYNDGSWIHFAQNECSYWCRYYGLPVIASCVADGTSCTAQYDQWGCPIVGENQTCVTKPWNYAIALAKKNHENIVEIMNANLPPTTTIPGQSTSTIVTTTISQTCKQKYAKCTADSECCSNICHRSYRWCT